MKFSSGVDGSVQRGGSLLVSIIFIISVLFSIPASGQDWGKIDFQSTELSPTMWVIYGAGGNHLLATGPEGHILVDADYREMGEKLLAKVNELAGEGQLQVINTHWHFDHVGGNQILKSAGAEVIAHENVRLRMISGQYLDIIDHEQPPANEADLPVTTFVDSLTLKLGPDTVTVFHTLFAHTDGDAVVHFSEANVIHTGDLVFNCGYPFIDLNAGGGIDGVIAAIKIILALCDEETTIVPGHGPLADKAGLEAYLAVLEPFRAAVAKAKAGGMNLEELLSSDVTAEIDQKWGKKMFPPEAFKEMVFRSLPD